MTPKLTTVTSDRQGMIVVLLVLLPLAMTVVFLTQSILAMLVAYFLLILLFVFRFRPTLIRRWRAVISGHPNSEELLSTLRGGLAHGVVFMLICPISLALALELTEHAVLAFKDAQHSDTDLDSIAAATEITITITSSLFWLGSTVVLYYYCICMKPEGGTVTLRQVLFLVYLLVMCFIFLIWDWWFFERLDLISMVISGKGLPNPVSDTQHVPLSSIVVLVAFYSYYKISIVLFERLVTKDKKLQFKRSMLLPIHYDDLPENKPIKEKQGMLKLLRVKMLKSFGAIERGGLLSVIVANSACLLAIIIYLYI